MSTSAGVSIESSAITTTTTTTTVPAQSALTSVLSASWSVLLPQITATIRKEVNEAMQQASTSTAAASGKEGMIK